MSHFLNLIRLDITIYLRNPAGTFWTIIFPVLLFTLLFVTDVGGGAHLGRVWIDVDDREASVDSRHYVDSLLTLARQVDAIRIDRLPVHPRGHDGILTLTVDQGFSAALHGGSRAHVALSNGRGNERAVAVAWSILTSLNDRLNLSVSPAAVRIEMTTPAASQTASPLRYATYTATGILAMMVFSTCLFGFTLPIVGMRQSGQLKMLELLPIGRYTLCASVIVARLLIVLAYAAIFGLYVFVLAGCRLAPTWPSGLELAVLIVLACCAFLSIGAVIAALVERRDAAVIACNCLYFIFVFTSDVFVPNKGIPDAMLALSENFPLHILAAGIRAVAQQGDAGGAYSTAFEAGIKLLAWIALGLATLLFLKYLPRDILRISLFKSNQGAAR